MASLFMDGVMFDEICRCCMASKPRMKPLFDKTLHTMLSSVTGIPVSRNDGLPTKLCVPCVLQIRRAHAFKIQCELTDNTLRNFVLDSKFAESEDQDFPQLPIKQRIKQDTSVENDSLPAVGDGMNGDELKLERKYVCPQCSKSFELERKLKRHMRIHASQRPHACPECDMTFVEKSNLSKHMRKHTGELRNSTGKPHLCAECGKAFKYSTSLSRHKRLHANRNLFTCHICLKGYVEQQTLDTHMRTHTNERPYACPSCDKCFAQKVNLERHERTHTGEKPYSCDVCGNHFTQKSYLVIHKRIHTHEKPYECPSCSARFISRNAMKKHQRTPCSHRPYWCTYCKKSFRYKKCLRKHKRDHLLESPHACQYCDSRFMRAVKLMAHMKVKHPDVPCNPEEYGANEQHSLDTRQHNDLKRSPMAREREVESEYDDMSEEALAEEDDEEIEIENISMYDEDEEESSEQRIQDVQVVHVLFNGDGEPEVVENGDEQDEQYITETITIKEEPLLAIKIMNPGEEDSDIEL